MNRLLVITTLLVLSLNSAAQEKWEKEGVKFPAQICYASDKVAKNFITPPNEFLNRLKSSDEQTANIVVTYYNFPEEAQAAFEYAVSIWEYLIKSPVTIYMDAQWSQLDQGVLGGCAPNMFYENFEAAPYKDTYYPVALVEKLQGKEVTGSSTPDMSAEFSSSINWYFGTDGDTPPTRYDFVSIVLHEIAHGLGFTGFFFENNNMGAYGYYLDYPGIYDRFVINSDGDLLTDSSLFGNPSEELLNQMTSGYLESKSETAKAKSTNNKYPRLYAPSEYDSGSSIYHLNEFTYLAGDTNSLMTPQVGKAEAIHNPGPLVMGMFADMGWVYTSIIHDELKDRENNTEPIKVVAKVESDTKLDSTSVYVFYSTSGSEEFTDSLNLIYSQEENAFITYFPILPEGEVYYYLAASDTSETTFFLPAQAPEIVFSFKIGEDTIPPELSHVPVKYMLESEQSAPIEVNATDNLGIAQVKVEYKINNQEVYEIILSKTGENLYTGEFNFSGLADGDSISYQVIAIDDSQNANSKTLPETGYYTFYVEGLYEPVYSYTNDFNVSSRDFISADFHIGTETNFDDGALHSPHPYPSPEQDNTTYDFVTLLKYPIILSENKTISYKEVVLVEPGEDGSKFGDDNFWDYVIVEGSKNGKDNWLPLIDGYDSRASEYWETYYNNTIIGQDSRGIGRKGLYIERTFNLTENGNFNSNDTIFIRFRLFSDPYAHGWGWVIDDLAIQEPTLVSSLLEISQDELILYPNPTSDVITIKGNFNSRIESIRLNIVNSSGQIVLQKDLSIHGNYLNESIVISYLQDGLYLLSFQFKDGQVITKRIIKQ